MTPPRVPELGLHEVTLGEWGRYAIVLPARSPRDALAVADLLRAAFDLAPFHETEKLPPPPGAPHKPPELRNPERLIGHLAELYHRMTLTGPDRRVFAREFDIVESQVDYLRAAGHGKLNPALRLHDRLVVARRQPHHVVEAGWLRRAPANPPENASQLRARHIQKLRELSRRAVTAHAPQEAASAKSSTASTAQALRREWQELKTEHTHVVPDPQTIRPRTPQTQMTYYDRLKPRTAPRPSPTPEQDNTPEYD